jgi:tripeptide aminopeptidase
VTPDSSDDPRVLETFLEAVRIDSPAGQEARFAAWCAQRLWALGCDVRFDETGPITGSDSGNLIAEQRGTASGPVIVLSAHMDTVEPGRGIVPVVEGGVVRSKGRTILAADDKAGVAAILEALERVREQQVAIPTVRVLLTTGEEMGLQGAKALDAAECVGDVCLVLDAHGSVGGIVAAAPTQYTFNATFTGVSAHAGVEPEKGVSAIAMAAAAICRMRIGRIDFETTANVGEIAGGHATNVITESVVMRGECRSIDTAKVDALRTEMEDAMQAAAADAGGSVRTLWSEEYQGYRFSEDDPYLRLVEDALRGLGIEPVLFDTGGGSDGNVLHGKGLPSIVLSCGMTDVHGVDESLEVRDLELLADLLVAVLLKAAS